MQDRDWTGTAAAVTALALTAGVWLWPSDEPPRAAHDPAHRALAAADQNRLDEELARWRAEARRWDGDAGQVQLSAAGTAEALAPVVR